MLNKPAEVYIVTGGRDYNNRDQVNEVMQDLIPPPRLVIHGGARGLDSLVDEWCKARGIHTAKVNALWDFFGKPAGGIRNRAMVEFLKPEKCVAFPGGTGTKNCKRVCREFGIPILESNK